MRLFTGFGIVLFIFVMVAVAATVPDPPKDFRIVERRL